MPSSPDAFAPPTHSSGDPSDAPEWAAEVASVRRRAEAWGNREAGKMVLYGLATILLVLGLGAAFAASIAVR